MAPKSSKLYSILSGTCPRCHQGKIFKYPPYSSLEFTKMNERCDYCGQAFEPEPGFYQGAMYVSYGLSTGLFLTIGVILLFFLELEIWLTAVILTVLSFLLLPVLFRLSRIIWIHFFVRYKPLDTKAKRP
jgi:uncharacterized protein (DUF983 family)